MKWKDIDYRCFGVVDGLMMLLLIIILAWVFVFYPRGTNPAVTQALSSTAEIFTEDGKMVVIRVDDFVRVTHKDRHAGGLTTLSPGLYKVRGIAKDAIGEVVSLTDPRFPERIFRCGTDILWAQSKYVILQPCTSDAPEYEAVAKEYAKISPADDESVASNK